MPNLSMTSVPFVTAFSPTSVESLALWLDGTDPAGTGTAPSAGATVSTWVDKSTSAKNATAGGTPTYVSGGGINFNGSSWFSNTSFSQNLSQRSIFIVMQETTRTAVGGVFPLIPTPSSGNDYDSTGLSVETQNGLRFYNGAGYQSDIGNASLLVKAVYNDNMNVRAGTGFINGNAATTVTASYTGGTSSGYGIGARWLGGINLTYSLRGVIFEIMYFNSPLGTTDRRNIEGYLAQKWGVTAELPVGHPGLSQTLFSATPALRSLGGLTSTLMITCVPYGPVGFLPTSVGSLVLWFDAEDTATMTFSGSTVTSWTSKGSATVSTSVVSGGFTNPTYSTYNSLPALEFNGTSTYIQTGNVSVPGTGTTWITCSVNLTPVTVSTPVDSSIVLATSAPGERAIRYHNTGGNTYYTINRNPTNTADLLRGNINENANGIRGFMDTASYFTGFTNGTQTVSNTNAVTYVAPANQPFLMGKWASGYLNGYIYESLVYNGVLTLAEYQQVEGYLAQKWGFTASLPVGHPGLTQTLFSPRSRSLAGIISTVAWTNKREIYGSVQFTYLPISPYSGNQYLSASVTAPSTDSVTYECWFYQTTQNSGNNSIMSSRTGGGGNGGVQIGINSYWGGFSLATPTFLANYGFAPSLNTWHHIALVRNGTSAWTFYYDGIAKTSNQGATFTFTSTTSTDIFIGAFTESGYPQQFTGYVTNFRYVKGVAVYTGNFTVPTTALTVTQSAGTNISAITAGQTQLLLLQASTGLLTDTANNTTVTNTGTATWNALTPF